MIGRRLSLFVAMIALVVSTAALAAPAHAAIASISCTGWQYDTYSPGLTNRLQSTTVVLDEDLNVLDGHSPTGSCIAVGSRATAEEADLSFTANDSCTQLVIQSPMTETFNWNDGRTTTVSASGVEVRGLSNTVITYTGAVTSGEFSGDSFLETLTALNTAFADCSRPGGVGSLDFAETVTIV
jgi:hypothetical protein